MRRAVRAGLAVALVAGWPLAGHAQDAVIQIEAKRGAGAAAEAAAGWGQQFDDVVTFPMARGWFAIALGPLDRAEADARLTELKAANAIPADSFVSEPGDVELTPVEEDAQPDAADVPSDAGGAGNASLAAGVAAEVGGLLSGDDIVIDSRAGNQPGSVEETVTGQVPGDVTAAPEPEEEAEPEPAPQLSAPGTHIRLQTLSGQGDAETALAEWRKTFPAASLWQLPGGRFAIAIGPMEDATATAWLAALRESGDLPRDAFTSDAAEMGEAVDLGADADLPAPPAEPQEMPPLDEVQRALRWAGYYDGDIDGTTGPRTRAAIAAGIAGLRLSPDAGTAMRMLMERRAEWRAGMGLSELRDAFTGLSVIAPLDVLEFNRNERSLAIYGPKNDSGAALILFSQPGGQQELLDMTGLITALGWVPQPERDISQGHALLQGQNAEHIGYAEGWVRDGRTEGFVLIWAASAPADQARVAAELSDSLSRFAPAQNDPQDSTAPADGAQP